MSEKLRRTLLWTKGHHPKEVEAAIASNADAIVFECEDMVIAPEKEAALQGAAYAMTNLDFRGKERIIRPNALDTERGQRDLEIILPCKPDAIRLPKCEYVEDILRLDERISRFEAERGWAHNSIELILTLETPMGVRNAYELASCTDRVTGMGLGAGDLTSAMGVDRDLTPGSLQLLYAKQKMVMDGKAAGVQLFDTTVICFGDELDDFIAKDTAFIKSLGFTGRSVSMLRHIDIINRVFAPTAQEVELAQKMVAGYAEGVAKGLTDVFVDGHFVDPPIVAKAEAVLEMDRLIRERAQNK